MLPHRTHHRASAQEKPGDQPPAQPGELAAPGPQPPGCGHLDVPGLRGHPDGLYYLEAMAQHAEKGNPELSQTGGALAQGSSPDHAGEGSPD
ncbi:hypothetical protein MTO96_025673 [Rhipicephalus appendiculatus]